MKFFFFYSVVITSSGFIGDLRKYYYQVGLLYILFIYHNMCVVYKDMSEAVAKHPEADVLVNFASLRSAYEATVDAMNYQQVSVSF